MPLSFKDYDRQARATAIFPNDTLTGGLTYCALGLVGESGEVAEQAKKMLRDDGGKLTVDRETKMFYELGDALWYISNMANELGYELEDIAQGNLDKLASRKDRDLISGEGSDR